MTTDTLAKLAADKDLIKQATCANVSFEAWAIDTRQGYDLSREDRALMATYRDIKTEHAWRGYCYAALTAQALPAAEPVAWWIPKAEQFALAKPSGSRPFASAWEPLYAAPQAAKQAEQSTTGGGVTTGAPSEPFGYFKAQPFGWTDCAETDDGAVALYEGPQQAAQAAAGWQPIETAPRGNGDDPSIKLVTDPRWIEPPMVLLLFRGGETAVGIWDWYYADGGSGRIDGCAWVEPTSGEVLSQHYDPPTHWMPLPQPQPQSAQTKGDA